MLYDGFCRRPDRNMVLVPDAGAIQQPLRMLECALTGLLALPIHIRAKPGQAAQSRQRRLNVEQVYRQGFAFAERGNDMLHGATRSLRPIHRNQHSHRRCTIDGIPAAMFCAPACSRS
jgi:hypothetical protein